MYLWFSAITIGVRILGPALGFILGSFCTMIYVDLSMDPPITPADPRWIGAWWLGKCFQFDASQFEYDRISSQILLTSYTAEPQVTKKIIARSFKNNYILSILYTNYAFRVQRRVSQ